MQRGKTNSSIMSLFIKKKKGLQPNTLQSQQLPSNVCFYYAVAYRRVLSVSIHTLVVSRQGAPWVQADREGWSDFRTRWLARPEHTSKKHILLVALSQLTSHGVCVCVHTHFWWQWGLLSLSLLPQGWQQQEPYNTYIIPGLNKAIRIPERLCC